MSSLLAYLNLSTGACTFLIALALPSVSHPRPPSSKEMKAHVRHGSVFWVRQRASAALSRIRDFQTSVWILASATYGFKCRLRARSECWWRARTPGVLVPTYGHPAVPATPLTAAGYRSAGISQYKTLVLRSWRIHCLLAV